MGEPCFFVLSLIISKLEMFFLMVKHNATKIEFQKDEGVFKKSQGELGNS